jgi:hypothetical protein
MMIATLALSGAAHAADPYPWSQHEAPFTFLFGNELDTHQQTRQGGDGGLLGFLYVRFTDVTTKDGYRVATHVDCAAQPGCTVGWTMRGKPLNATFLYHALGDHHIFLLNRADITQPGSPSHFHWLGPAMPMPGETLSGYLLQLTAVDRFCFIHHEADAATSDRSCRDNGGVPVNRGIDIATHLNIVTSTPPGI